MPRMKKNLPASAVFCALYLARLRSSRKRPHLKVLLLKKSRELKESCERKALSHFFLKNPIHAICGGRGSGAGALGRAGGCAGALGHLQSAREQLHGRACAGRGRLCKKRRSAGRNAEKFFDFLLFLRPCMRVRVCLACGRVRRRWAGVARAIFLLLNPPRRLCR